MTPTPIAADLSEPVDMNEAHNIAFEIGGLDDDGGYYFTAEELEQFVLRLQRGVVMADSCSLPEPVAGSSYSSAKAALLEIETYFEEREDVVDGNYGRPEPNKEMTMLRWVREVIDFLAKADSTSDVFKASATWPEDIRKKLSAHDLRRMGGWTPRTKVGDWRIDTSAGGPILVYQDCSVIESEQARYVMSLIENDANLTRGSAEVEAPFIAYEKWIGLDEARELYTSTADQVREAIYRAVLAIAPRNDSVRSAAIALREAQRAYMADRGNDEKGAAVARAAEALDAALAAAPHKEPKP